MRLLEGLRWLLQLRHQRLGVVFGIWGVFVPPLGYTSTTSSGSASEDVDGDEDVDSHCGGLHRL